MTNLKSFFGIIAVVGSSLTSFAGDCSSLSGEYKIAKENGDFATITEAVSNLKCGGVSGSVRFLIESGKYTDKIDLTKISGVSAQNTITFESLSGAESDVILASSSQDQSFTVGITNTSYVNFSNLTLQNNSGLTGNVVRIDGNVSAVKFKNVIFDGSEKQVTGANNAVIYSTSNGTKRGLSLEDCTVNNGSVGVYKGGLEVADEATSISGTTFFNQYEGGLVINGEKSPVLSYNVLSSVSNYKGFKAITLNSVNENLIVSNNIVNTINGGYGLAMNNCEGLISGYGNITNNSFYLGGQGTLYGLYLSGKTDNQVLNFNRVKLTPTTVNSANQAFYMNIGSGQNINLTNNIFFDLGTGGYTILGNTYKDYFNQLPPQSNQALSVSANGIMIEKVMPAN